MSNEGHAHPAENSLASSKFFKHYLEDDIEGMLADLREAKGTECAETAFAVLQLENMVATASTKDAQGNEHLIEIMEALEGCESRERAAVFVYGTLLTGMPAEELLEGAGYAGDALLPNTYLYDMGTYPAISERKRHDDLFGGARFTTRPGVVGEVRLCGSETLRKLARYEDEGHLYDLKSVMVLGPGGEPMEAYSYFYRFDELGQDEMPAGSFVPRSLQPYTRLAQLKRTHVWYVAYGSNMLYERLMRYIEGGVCTANGRRYAGCADKTRPLASVAYDIDHSVYFGNESASWDGRGVAFLDVEAPGSAIGRAYLVTKEQLRDIHAQEGRGAHWYPDVVELGQVGGIPAVTLTNRARRVENAPSEGYLEVMRRGLEEALWNECDIDSQAYIERLRSRAMAR